ncbi:hypothetical protein FACS18945_5980 [Bacteroidia bacterium]|nr:hypothetical protein FACS18945_5980 [Bacteroidia bacterium]
MLQTFNQKFSFKKTQKKTAAKVATIFFYFYVWIVTNVSVSLWHYFKNKKFMTVTAEIDVTRPAGIKLIRTIEQHKSVAKINYVPPQIGSTKNTFTTDDVFNMCADILNQHYGTNLTV